jgi:hypothetical protein
VTVGTETVTDTTGVVTVTGGGGGGGIAGTCGTDATTPPTVSIGALETVAAVETAADSGGGSVRPLSEGRSFVGALRSFPRVETAGAE